MKKALLMFLALSLFSCSSDESNKEESNFSIVGRWHQTDILEDGKPISGYSCNKEFDIYEFTEAKQAIVKYSDRNSNNICTQYTENGTYTLSDSKISIINKKGNVIVYNATFKIKELTATSLKLEAVSIFEANDNGSNPNSYSYSANEEVRVYNKLN